MAAKGPSPLLGYNTNVRHKGVLCHVQTEDSGVGHPHIITHLFTAGTIISTKKRAYAEHLGATNLEVIVRKLMQEQHKQMCISLRDGEFDQALRLGDTQKIALKLDDEEPPEAPVAPSPAPALELELELELEPERVPHPTRRGEPAPVALRPRSGAAQPAVVAPAKAARADETEPTARPVLDALPTPPDTPAVKPRPRAPSVPRAPQVAPPILHVAGDRETPPPPPSLRSKPPLPAASTYKESTQETTRTSTSKPRSGVGRRSTPGPIPGGGPGGYTSSRAPSLFGGRRTPTPPPPERASSGLFGAGMAPPPAPADRGSIFGQEHISEKSLDEVILAYLSEEVDE